MKKIDKLIITSFLGPFILTFFVVIFILLSQFMLRYFDEIIGKDLGMEVIAQLIFYFAIFMTPNGFPLAVLLSSLMTFGNLGEHFELTAIKSAGISLLRTMRSIFVFSLVLTAVAFYSNNHLVPKAALKAFSLLYDVKHKKPSLEIKEGAFYNGIDGYSIKVNRKSPDGQGLYDIIIYDHTKGGGNRDVIIADSGRMFNVLDNRYLILELFNGQSYSEQKPERQTVRVGKAIPEPFVRNHFSSAKIAFNMSSFDLKRTKEELFAGNRMMKNASQLTDDVDSMNREVEKMIFEVKDNLYQNFRYHLKDVRDAHQVVRNEFYKQFAQQDPDFQEEVQIKAIKKSDSTKNNAAIAENMNDMADSVSQPTNSAGDIASNNVNEENRTLTAGEVKSVDTANNVKTPEKLKKINLALRKKLMKVRKDQLQDTAKNITFRDSLPPPPVNPDGLVTYNVLAVESQTDSTKNPNDSLTWEDSIAKIDSLFSTSIAESTAIQNALTKARNSKNHLNVQSKRLENTTMNANSFQHERHKKLSYAVTIVIMFLIGAPLGSIIKRGGLGVPVIISIAFFILFYVISMVTEKYVKQNLMDPLVGAWMANIWLFPVGLFLLRQARNDARLLDLDFYHVAYLKIEKQLKALRRRIVSK